MILVPVKDSLLYVEPVYITTNNTAAFPELKRIIVAYKENIVMEATLQECFNKLFSGGGGTSGGNTGGTGTDANDPSLTLPAEGTDGEAEQILKTVVELYERYKQYNAENDFENAGKIMRDIDANLNRANELFAAQGQEQVQEGQDADASPTPAPQAETE